MPSDNVGLIVDFAEDNMRTSPLKYLPILDERPLDDYLDADILLRLLDVLEEARSTGCLSYGLYRAGKQLERKPQLAKLCVLSKEDENLDPGASMLMYLLETICWANNIPVLRVKNFHKILKGFFVTTIPGNSELKEHCLLVKVKSEGRMSEKLNALMQMGFALYHEGKEFECDAG